MRARTFPVLIARACCAGASTSDDASNEAEITNPARFPLAPLLCVACAAPAPDASRSEVSFSPRRDAGARDLRARRAHARAQSRSPRCSTITCASGRRVPGRDAPPTRTTHRVELAVYDALLARADRVASVLAMEMFERDVQTDARRVPRGRDRRSDVSARARAAVVELREPAYRP
jgi:hypothetical protein